ncbi:type II and III secretion system protein family protein [Verticiella sediminum]|nr:pilus assembly protein N-terminal domain-containing protein [Verticiella sediminum]
MLAVLALCAPFGTATGAADARWAQWAAPPPERAAAVLDQPLPDSAQLEMFVGETRVVAAPDVARIAVGDGAVLHAVAADGREVVVFARAAGSSSLVMWARDGSSRSMRVDVVPGESRRVRAELAQLLARIPNARSTALGDKLVVEGEDLSDDDRARVAELAARYPQVVDFTGRVGWDRMVMIDVQVLELPRSRVQDLGVRWDGVAPGLNVGAAWDAGSLGRLSAAPGSPVLPAVFPAMPAVGYLGLNTLLSSRLHALTQRGDAVLLAQPQLMARSGATASFLAGGELPYTTIDANGNTSTTFKPYGVGLEVTPSIDAGGAVRARIDVEVSAVDPVVTTSSGPALRTRRTSTEFNVRSGETLVLSGFLSREHVTDEDGIPGLARIPVLGALFRARRTQQRDTELAIFVTPVVLGEGGEGLGERVRRGRRLLEDTFAEPLRMLTPVAHDPFALRPEHSAPLERP